MACVCIPFEIVSEKKCIDGDATHDIGRLLPELLRECGDAETDAEKVDSIARPREPAGPEEGPLQRGEGEQLRK